MPPLDNQFEYAGITLGADTGYELTNVEGLDPTDVREDIVQKTLDHGSFIFGQYMEHRRVTLEGFIIDNSQTAFQDKINQLRAATVPRRTVEALLFKEPTQPIKRIECIPTKRNISLSRDYALGYTTFAVQFLAGDPRIYADTESTLVGAGTANNAGIFPTFPIVTVTGAATNPRVTNSTTGELLRVNTTVSVGQTLTIDFLNRTIKLNTGASLYSFLDPTSVWFDLEPCNNSITYSTGTFQMRWRSAWL